MLELIDIIKASEGKDENGMPKSSFSLIEQLMSASDEVKTLKEHVFVDAEIKVVLNGDYLMVDLIFSASSAELRTLWNHLENFGNQQNKYFDKDEDPILEFLVVPLALSGKYYYSLINPICWTMQPSYFNGHINTIRLLFEKRGLNFFESDGVDEKEIDAEIEKEEYEKERLIETEKRKQEEHDEYLGRLNKHFNKMQ